MAIGNGLSGFTETAPYDLVVDAGVIYKNINLTELRAGGSTAFQSAIDSGNTWTDPNGTVVAPELMGLTLGGSTVKLNREERQVEFDSRRTNVKGMSRINMVNPQIMTSLLQVGTPETITMALGTSETTDHVGWREIVPQLLVQDTDYIANIALCATISGENQPMVIVLENARVVDVGDMKFEDKKEAVFELTFQGHSLPSDPLKIPIAYFCPQEYTGNEYTYTP